MANSGLPPTNSAARRRTLPLIGIATFAICLVSGLVALIPYRERFYNSDVLYLPALYRSLANGGNLANWVWPRAPFIFPDYVLYFIANALVPNIHLAIILTGIAQLLAFVAGLLFISFAVRPNNQTVHFFVLLAGALYFVVFIKSGMQYPYALLMLLHFGTAITVVWCFGLWLRLVSPDNLSSGSRFGLWAVFIVLVFTGSLSDLLFVVQFVAPSLACLIYLRLTRQIDNRRVVLCAGLTALPCGLGIVGLKLIFGTVQADPIMKVNRARLMNSLHVLLDLAPKMTALGWVYLGIGTLFLVVSVVIAFRAFRIRGKVRSYETVIAFLLAMTLINVAALMPDGQIMTERYLIPAILFPVLYGWPFVIGALPRLSELLNSRAGHSFLVGCAVLLCISQLPPLARIQSLSEYGDYYPPLVQCVDEHLGDTPVRSGLANYWQARYITLLSRKRIFVAQMTPQLTPYLWLNNRLDYNREFEFIIMAPQATVSQLIHPETVIARYGEPAEQFKCQNSNIFVYDRPSDTVFRQQFVVH